ncbi:MAG TPA: OmpW family outer membrane protein [Gemmatimonadales bacterium]|nr:OmpW family outer membrane protein [Gemmatimonadales bacterium]
MSHLVIRPLTLACLGIAVAVSALHAQSDWTFQTRAIVTGSSDRSDPTGYTVYTALAWEAGIARTMPRGFAIELSVRTESREVDLAAPPGPDLRLGSLEVVPVNLLVRYALPPRRTVRPYVGLGATLTMVWEKSGALDADGFSPSIGPAVEGGVDVELTPTVLLTGIFRWNVWRTDRRVAGVTVATLKIDPATLGVGLAFRL